MALFEQKQLPISDVAQLREMGLTDSIITNELSRKGYSQQQIAQALAQAPSQESQFDEPVPSGPMLSSPQEAGGASGDGGSTGNIYERIEEITESMIDEKWDELISEVKKIVEWKEKIEEKQAKIINDVDKLKENFKILHEGVLGKLEDYDSRMQEVGTELKAVGKVFKDVIPEFVENVKELSSVTGRMKNK